MFQADSNWVTGVESEIWGFFYKGFESENGVV
jgi:hypothetical protein